MGIDCLYLLRASRLTGRRRVRQGGKKVKQITRQDARQPADVRVLAVVHVAGDDAFRVDQRVAE